MKVSSLLPSTKRVFKYFLFPVGTISPGLRLSQCKLHNKTPQCIHSDINISQFKVKATDSWWHNSLSKFKGLRTKSYDVLKLHKVEVQLDQRLYMASWLLWFQLP